MSVDIAIKDLECTVGFEHLSEYEFRDLRHVHSWRDATFPDLHKVGEGLEYPKHSIFVTITRSPAILFTPEHHQMLYLLLNNRFLSERFPIGAKRVLVNVDDHDDYEMNQESGVNAGNWGRKGIELNCWSGFIHLSKNNYLAKYHAVPDIHQLGIPWQSGDMEKIFRIIGERPYILTIDADEFVARGFNRTQISMALRRFKIIVKQFINSSNKPEMIHFTPSPIFCPISASIEMWNILIDELKQSLVEHD